MGDRMVLGDRTIKQAIEAGHIRITPFDKSNLERVHINLHLDLESRDSLEVMPHSFLNLKTLEKITLSNEICAFVEGRSKLAQQGLSVEQSSTLVEPGTDSNLTLEIFNASDEVLVLKHAQKIAKIIFVKVSDNF